MYPPIAPFERGTLERPDGATIYWEMSGSRDGVPALYLHGGPGGDLGRGGYRRRFDPDRFLIVGIDQRGSGKSRPHAVDSDIALNTTSTMIHDIEAIRDHLRIDRWLVHGVSWGTTLALAYALEYPQRIKALVLMAVTTGSREEIDWITRDVGRIFPESWSKFAAVAEPGERIVDAYVRLMSDADAEVRRRAASAWNLWENTHVSLDPLRRQNAPTNSKYNENFARLVSWYWANDCFLDGDDRVLKRAHQLASIPGALVHGRLDVSGPTMTPWLLHDRWPGSTLEIIEEEGHGGPLMIERVIAAIDRLG